jgi:putative ABC transport system permease protein
MNFLDMVVLGFDNLRRTKLRTFLTTLGVVIGIGALASMVSFGTGMQKNVTDTFKEGDLFTSLFVTSKNINIEQVSEGDLESIGEALAEPPVMLTDSTVQAIMDIRGVDIAFPEIRFPVKLKLGEKETRTTLRALPAAMGRYKPFDNLAAGRFFENDSVRTVVVSARTLKRLKIELHSLDEDTESAEPDSLQETVVIEADSIIGRPISIISAAFDGSQLGADPVSALLYAGKPPVRETDIELVIGGILKRSSEFGGNRFRAGVIVPMKTAGDIPRLGFSSVWELLGRQKSRDAYHSLYVRTKTIKDVEPVRTALKDMGLNVVSISDELKEIKKAFMIMDSILGAVGIIALIVAGLGIINTMVMSILERTREIGILKAIGGSEREIKMIFFVEAAVIGLIGAVFGLLLGWGVTRIVNLVVNTWLMPDGELYVNFFYFPVWLILGATAFSVIISLIAGLYPAARAARVDPVQALRHD